MATFLENAPTAADRSTWPILPGAGAGEKKYVALMSAPYLKPHLERFGPIYEAFGVELLVPEVEERMEPDEIEKHANTFDATICGDDRYNKDVLKACLPRLKVISKWGTGIDSIDKVAANGLGIKVGNTLNAFSKPVSDSIMGYMLSFCRRLPWSDKMMKNKEWEKIAGKSLSECTIGLIGMGNIGKSVAKRAFGFEAKVLGTDIIDIDPKFLDTYNVEMTGLDDVLSRSDFVCVTCQLTPETTHLVNAAALAKMKKSAVLINCARGPIVKEVDLVAALQAGTIAGAAMDVFEFEPLPHDSPLISMDNVMMAPHNSNSSPTAHENIHWSTLRNLCRGLDIPFEQQHEIVAESVCE